MTGSWKFCVDDPGVCDPRILVSSMSEHPAAQQVEPGPSVHLPLDDLEPVDLTLDLAVAPRLGQRGAHRVLIAPEANGARALTSASRSQPSSATWSLIIVTKRLTRSTAVAMAGERSSSAATNRRSASSSVSG